MEPREISSPPREGTPGAVRTQANDEDAVFVVKRAITDGISDHGSALYGYGQNGTLTDAIFAAIFRPEVRWAAVVVGTMPEREEV